MTTVLGLDVGATYTKGMVMDGERRIVAQSLIKTGFNLAGAADKAYEEALAAGGLAPEDVHYVASTGYGRYLVPMRDIQITELTCHARGAAYLFPLTRTVLDAGGQTVKAIKVDERGKVRAFRLNDKCAAGTGAFLDKTARYMGLDTSTTGELATRSLAPVTISSVCAVFAESEVINHLTAGAKPEDIMYGAVLSLAGRAIQLMKRVGMEQEVTFVGGMSRNAAFVKALAAELGKTVNVPAGELGQFNGSLGACLLALDRVHKLQSTGQWQNRSLMAAQGAR
ncbi:MAG TPA: acyl-CoA dehydratase activase [Candidatus Dormibacteraeota bacterium]|nr:acyl-CoA dehydratase activase [Candidatus Dormibacteraeota bacterium]